MKTLKGCTKSWSYGLSGELRTRFFKGSIEKPSPQITLLVHPLKLQQAEPSSRDRPGTGVLFLLGLWFGLVTGLLELSLSLGLKQWDHRVTVDSIRTNRHWIWMIPISDVLIFASCGLLLGFLVRLWPRLVSRVAPYVLCTLAFFALLLTIKGLYLVACTVLACGLAARTAPLIDVEAGRVRRLIRVSTPLLAGVVVLLVGVVGSQVALAERRARASLARARPGAPNVLLIVLDDVRVDDLSLYGYHRDTTPNLARLARRGIRFDQARASAPWTLPSHASMLTGRWPHQLSATVDQPLDATYPTLAEFLAGQGYDTAGFVGNTFYCNGWYGLDRGFAHYEDFYENRVVSGLETLRSSTLGQRLVAASGFETATPGAKGSRKSAAMINRDALGWLSQRGDRPFFVFLNYYDAHAPFQPPVGFDRRYGLAARPQADRESVLRRYSRLSQGKELDGNAQALISEAAELRRDSYDGCIASLDDQLGRLFAELERRGLLANTLVIVTSDHGEHFNDHQLFGHGNSLYGALIHVPLLIFPPSVSVEAAGRVVNAPVSLRNLPATVVDQLGMKAQAPFPGLSLARHWTSEPEPEPGPAGPLDDPLLAEVELQTRFPPSPHIPASLGPLQSLVAEQRVYIRNSDGREELYDLERDPAELNNLAGAADAPPFLERFRRSLTHHLHDIDPHRSKFADLSRQRNVEQP